MLVLGFLHIGTADAFHFLEPKCILLATLAAKEKRWTNSPLADAAQGCDTFGTL
jgi:hypothetical protein